MQITLNLTDIIVAFIAAAFSGSGIIAIYINHKLNQNDEKSEEIIKANERVAEYKTIYYNKLDNLLQTLYFVAKGRTVNGDLDKHWEAFKESSENLHNSYISRSRIWKNN